MSPDSWLIGIAILCCIYSFFNGWNDSHQGFICSISNKVVHPKMAIMISSVGNLLGSFIGFTVAKTIATRFVELPTSHGVLVLFVTLIVPITWMYFSSRLSLPVSSTHSLVSSLFGMAIGITGTHGINHAGASKFFYGIIVAPFSAIILGCVSVISILWLTQSIKTISHRALVKINLFSAFTYSLANGSNDAQKANGILLFACLTLGVAFPFSWVVGIALSLFLGTFLGGLYQLRYRKIPWLGIDLFNGTMAQIISTLVMSTATVEGVPLSSTQVIASSIYGSNLVEKRASWGSFLFRKIFYAWFLTFPFCFLATLGMIKALKAAGFLN